ncbi:hypothetical protein NEHOM01_0160 [Nematocida homosporus]|uniref:uncharacterized protein n=1 Tax=Nematocida homosporus TaxID=1912981 RepID=UPI00221F28ED|nr:uncharacterized protein NEHOM01_0160 [Nematocida homosporus]KAI5184415.1 hypothetical protein NEHOM01_0160 [Nematocida homosporus]
MIEKTEALHRAAKVVYLSAQKYAGTLASMHPEAIPDKLRSLEQYLRRKEVEVRALEAEIEAAVLKEEEASENEVLLQVADFLGTQGLVKTATTLISETKAAHLISLNKYCIAQEYVRSIDSIPATPAIEASNTNTNSEANSAFITWRFATLCQESRSAALVFCKQNQAIIPVRALSLLVLPPNSLLFQKIADSYAKRKVFNKLAQNMPQCRLYQRVALGISGFTTPACREKEESYCPGCSAKSVRIARGFPKSMRTTTRVLCSTTHQLIPEGAPILASPNGEVFLQSAVIPDSATPCSPEYRAFRRCYFV